MPLSKTFTASLLGVMSLSSVMGMRGARSFCDNFPDHARCTAPAPSSDGPNTSIAHCSAISWGYSEATNQDQLAEASANAQTYICGDGDGEGEAHAIATATAHAFAHAVADASAFCDLSGDSGGYANAETHAEAKAEVWLEAYAAAFADSTDCKHCEAWAEAWAFVRQEVFLKAVASAKATLVLYSNGGDVIGHVQSYMEDIEEAVVTAYAEALAGVATYSDFHECWAWVGVEGCIVSEENPAGACAECQADAVSTGYIFEIDGIAEASATAAVDVCGDHVVGYAETSVWASALAEATAAAISEVYVSCKTDDGYACAEAGTYVEEAANAVAKAFADAWAGAIVCDECSVNVDDASSSIGHILVQAATSAYGYVCASGIEHWTVTDFESQIKTEYLEAIAEACAYAFGHSSTSGSDCSAYVAVGTYVGPP